jgi:hypothetical protein
MNTPVVTTGSVTVLSILCCLVAYITKGSIPDVLTMITTTSAGGFLGVSIPTGAHKVSH